MLISSFSDLRVLLERDGVAHQADPDTRSVVIPTELGALSGELLMRWEESSHVFQCIHPLSFAIPAARLAAVESAIVRINHALLLPGFGLDHDSGFAYFRLAVPRRPDGTMLADDIRRLFGTAVETTHDFHDVLRAVAQDEGRPEDALSHAQAFVSRSR